MPKKLNPTLLKYALILLTLQKALPSLPHPPCCHSSCGMKEPELPESNAHFSDQIQYFWPMKFAVTLTSLKLVPSVPFPDLSQKALNGYNSVILENSF